ncbi:unnamed protein product, partial [Trichobilharzia szidati]
VLFMMANGLRRCLKIIDLAICSAVNQAFFMWVFFTLLFSAIYSLALKLVDSASISEATNKTVRQPLVE